MSRDMITRSLGGVQRAPGTPNLHTAPVPSVSSITGNPPLIDSALVSEEIITYSIIALPHPQDTDKAPRADQLLAKGDVLFGTRAETDPRVGVFSMDHVNIILQHAWSKYQELLTKKVKDILHLLQRTHGATQLDWMHGLDFSSVANVTLEELMTRSDYYSNEGYAGGGASQHTCIPPQLDLFLDCANHSQVDTAEKNRYRIPPNEPQSGQDSLLTGLAHLLNHSKLNDPTESALKMSKIFVREQQRAFGRDLIRHIFSGFPEITMYLTADGIVSKFNCLGIFVSSQEDTDLEAIQQRGGLRNINVAIRGPVEIMNFWGNAMIKGSYLSLILCRIRHDNGAWGAFQYKPYWSVVDDKSTQYGTASSIGPVDCRSARSYQVPSKELAYRDLSGRDALGHVLHVGVTRYPMGQLRHNAKPGLPTDTPLSIKGSALGLHFTPKSKDKYPMETTVRKSFVDKTKIAMVNVYIDM